MINMLNEFAYEHRLVFDYTTDTLEGYTKVRFTDPETMNSATFVFRNDDDHKYIVDEIITKINKKLIEKGE